MRGLSLKAKPRTTNDSASNEANERLQQINNGEPFKRLHTAHSPVYFVPAPLQHFLVLWKRPNIWKRTHFSFDDVMMMQRYRRCASASNAKSDASICSIGKICTYGPQQSLSLFSEYFPFLEFFHEKIYWCKKLERYIWCENLLTLAHCSLKGISGPCFWSRSISSRSWRSRSGMKRMLSKLSGISEKKKKSRSLILNPSLWVYAKCAQKYGKEVEKMFWWRVCMHVCTCIYKCTCIHTRLHFANTYIHIQSCIYTHIQRKHTLACTHTHTCIYTPVWSCLKDCHVSHSSCKHRRRTEKHANTHLHTHTHTYAYTHQLEAASKTVTSSIAVVKTEKIEHQPRPPSSARYNHACMHVCMYVCMCFRR